MAPTKQTVCAEINIVAIQLINKQPKFVECSSVVADAGMTWDEFSKSARNQHNNALYADEMALGNIAAAEESVGYVPPEDSRWYLSPDVDVTLATVGQSKTEFIPAASQDGQRSKWKLFINPHDNPPLLKAYAYVFHLRRDRKFHIRLSTEPIPPDDARIYNMTRLSFSNSSEDKVKDSQEGYQRPTKSSRLAIRPINHTVKVMGRNSSALHQQKELTKVSVKVTQKEAHDRTDNTPLPDETSYAERSSSPESGRATPFSNSHEALDSSFSELTDGSATPYSPISPQPTWSRSSSPDQRISSSDEESKPQHSVPAEDDDEADIPSSASLPPKETEDEPDVPSSPPLLPKEIDQLSDEPVPVSSELPDLQKETVSPSDSGDCEIESETESSLGDSISAFLPCVESSDPESLGPIDTPNVEPPAASDTDSKSDISSAAAESSATPEIEVLDATALDLAQLSSDAVGSETPGLISLSGEAVTDNDQDAASGLGSSMPTYTGDSVSGDFEDTEMGHSTNQMVEEPTSLPSDDLSEDNDRDGRSSPTGSVKTLASVSPAMSEALPKTRHGDDINDGGEFYCPAHHPSRALLPEPVEVPAQESTPQLSPSRHSNIPYFEMELSGSSSPDRNGSESSPSSPMASPEATETESASLCSTSPDGSTIPVVEISCEFPADSNAIQPEAAGQSSSSDSDSS